MTGPTMLTKLPTTASRQGTALFGDRERGRVDAPAPWSLVGAHAPSEPAAPADRHLGNLRLSG